MVCGIDITDNGFKYYSKDKGFAEDFVWLAY
jgi:hypothetical protein